MKIKKRSIHYTTSKNSWKTHEIHVDKRDLFSLAYACTNRLAYFILNKQDSLTPCLIYH
ncbi:MAG: hypothetical protein ACLUDU_23900 [Butyricimonas faecihominis]